MVKKSQSEEDCWIHKTSFMPLSGLMSWLFRIKVITVTWHNNSNDNDDNNKQK